MIGGERKSILKSVRLTQTGYDYVCNQKGKGFNEKFNKTVSYWMFEEKAKKGRIKDLEDEIIEKQQRLQELNSLIVKARTILGSLSGIEQLMGELIDEHHLHSMHIVEGGKEFGDAGNS